jgi:aspartate-semialdehyde dehydrogenase
MDELSDQVRHILNMKKPSVAVFPHQIAFNCLPQIDDFLEDGYTKEEAKMANETRKIFNDDSIKLTATTVRVPVFVGHSESINVETEKEASPEEVRELLRRAPGVEVVDEPEKGRYPMPLDCAERDEVFVGRIRRDDTGPNGLNLWGVSDNRRKGAALNAVQIAEILIKEYL